MIAFVRPSPTSGISSSATAKYGTATRAIRLRIRAPAVNPVTISPITERSDAFAILTRSCRS